MTWIPFDKGKTIGTRGTDAGQIVQDEEHLGGARIMLEKQCKHAPFSISCGIYGWMVHTRFLADQATAEEEYGKMKTEMVRILAMIPREELPDMEERIERVDDAIEDFVEQFA